MVNLTVRVTDINGNGIVGIPVNGKAIKNVIWGSNYTLGYAYTNPNGNAVYDNVEANENYNVTANSPSFPNYSNLWTSGSGTTNSGLIGNPQINIVLKKITSPINNVCQSGYTMTNGQCVQNSGISSSSILYSFTSIFTKYWWIILLFVIVLALIYYLLKKKKNNKPLLIVSNPHASVI
jgi:hypothetical protein